MLNFAIKFNNTNYKRQWNNLIFCKQWKMMSDLNMSLGKMPDLFHIDCIHFSHITEKFWFWKSMKYFNIFWQKRYDVRFEYVPWKNVWFCFTSILWVHHSHKTEKFRFGKSLKYFNIFLSKKWCQIWICIVTHYLIWAQFSNKFQNTNFKLYWSSLIFIN